jgi:TonB-dependent receptor
MGDVPDYTEFGTQESYSRDPITGGIHDGGRILKSTVATKSWERTRDQDLQGFLNLTYSTAVFGNDIDFKAGGMYRHKTRDNFFNEYGIGSTGSAIPYANIQSISPSSLALNTSAVGDAFANGNTYKEFENISAGYAQFKLFLMDHKLEVLGGARLEHTHLEDSVDLDPTLVAQVAGKYDYTDVLPSMSLKYKLSKKENVRLSYFESISRAGFFELLANHKPSDVFSEYGNPLLKHAVAQNLDARYELFPKGIDQILVGAFYKNISNPIEYFLIRPGGPSALGIQPQNVSSNAINYGAELQFTKFFHYVGVQGNYTYTHSSITLPTLYMYDSSGTTKPRSVNTTRPLQGQAAHIGNLALIYKNPKSGFDANISVQYTGRHITIASGYQGLDYWQKATTFLDFACEKRLVKHLFVYAKVQNILNSKTIVEINESNKIFTDPKVPSNYFSYQNLKDGKTLVEQTQIGRNYLIGVRYKMD